MTRGPRIAEVVTHDEHVSLGAAIRGQRGLRLVHDAPVEDLQVGGTQDGHIVEAEGFYGELFVRVRWQLVVARCVGGGHFLAS